MEVTPLITSDLETIKTQFENWRATRKGPRARIPANLWEAAIRLTETHSVCKVAKCLRLSYADLKKRITPKKKRLTTKKTSPSFIEFECKPPLMQSECIIEMEDRTGAKMKMCFRGDTNMDLLELGKAFWTKRS